MPAQRNWPEYSGWSRMATHWLRSCVFSVPMILRRRLLRVRREDLLLAIVLADDVEQVGEAIVVVVAGVRAEERLRHGPRRIVRVEGLRPAPSGWGSRSPGCGVSWISLPADHRMMLGWLRSRITVSVVSRIAQSLK